MISMVVLDLDGTLLAQDHRTVPSSAVRLLAELARSGVHIVPASGRALGLMEHELQQLPFVRWVVSSNGASVFDRSAQQPVVRRMTMPGCRAVDIYTLLDGYELSFELYHSGKAYLERSRLENFRQSFSAGFAAHLLAHTCLVDSLVPLFEDGSIEKFNVSGVSGGDRAEIAGFLSRFDDLTLTSSLEGNLEVTAAGVSKANALEWLADVLGVRSGDVVAFGDSGNDVGMLSWAGMSYAMGNGTEEVKAAARWVTGSNAHDGVATALRSLLSRGEPGSVTPARPCSQRRDVPGARETAR